MAKRQRRGRSTVYNYITSEEKMKQVHPDNLSLEKDFLDYLISVDRAKSTIKQYKANLHIFWCWNLEYNNNKFFVDLNKREIARFQSHALNEWKWSPKRVRTVKATISSLSNYIEAILDDEYSNFRPIVNKIESPANVAIREKTVFTGKDLKKLLDHLCRNEEYMKACMVSLAMNSGRRKAELTRFKVGYFTEENLICDGALYVTPEKMVTKGRGIRGKLLNIYTLSKPFNPYLRKWLRQREELGIKSEWLFPSKDNPDEPIPISTMDSWAESFTQYLRVSFYWHSLRHYFTTMLTESGIPSHIVQMILGWDSADMVNLYTDTSSEKQLEKYFGAEGIKKTKETSLSDL